MSIIVVPSLEAASSDNLKNTGILKVFAEENTTKIDSKFVKHLTRYVTQFVTKNTDHIHFFGSGLTGVHPLRFTSAHRNEMFDDVLDIDDIILKDKLHSLPDINPAYHVSSDIFNLTMVWLVYKIYNSSMSNKDKAMGMSSALKMLHYKFISSLMSKYFKYPADVSIAQATYHQLSLKFDLRMYETWGGLVEHRTSDFLTKGSLWWDTLITLKYDYDVVKLINDMQSRIRATVKVVTREYYSQRENDSRILSTSATLQLPDGVVIKDVLSDHAAMREYIQTVAGSQSFYKREILDITAEIIHTAPVKHIESAVEFIADNYGGRRTDYISEFIVGCADYCLTYIRDNELHIHDITTIVYKMRGVCMSSRNTEADMINIRELGYKIVKDSVRTKSDTVLASIRTALIIYVMIRMLLRSKYS